MTFFFHEISDFDICWLIAGDARTADGKKKGEPPTDPKATSATGTAASAIRNLHFSNSSPALDLRTRIYAQFFCHRALYYRDISRSTSVFIVTHTLASVL